MDKEQKLSNPKQAANNYCQLFIDNLCTCKISPYMVKHARIATLKMIGNGLEVKNIGSKGVTNLYTSL
jgi:hypothetical protein